MHKQKKTKDAYLVTQQLFALVFSVLLSEVLNSFLLRNFEGLELFAVVHGFVNALVNRHQFFVVLHDLESGVWLYLRSLDGAVQLAVQVFHLLLVIDLEAVDFLERLFFVLLETLLPGAVEVLQVLLADLHVLAHLVLLDVDAQLVLEPDYLGLEQAHFLHQVFVQLVLVHLAALFGRQLHFLLDERENEDLLVLIEDAITALVEHIDELLRRTQSEEIVDVLAALIENESDVGFIQKTLLAEISLLDGLPDFFALACTSDKGSCLRYEFFDFVLRHIGQAEVGLLTEAASDVPIDGASV